MPDIPTTPAALVTQLRAAGNELIASDPSPGQRAAWRRVIYALINSDAIPDGYCLRHTGRDHGDLTVRLVPRVEGERTPPAAPVPIPDRLVDPHPLVAATRRAAGNRTTGWVDTRREPNMLHVNVTCANVRRVLRLAQALINEAERRGHHIRTFTSHQCAGGLGIFVGTHGYELVFAEETTRVAHQPTKAELDDAARYSWSRPPPWDHVPSGRIQLRIGHSGMDQRLTGDRARWKLDDRLGQALERIEAFAAAAEQRDLETQAREAQVRAEWEAAITIAGDRYREALRAERLGDQINQWRLAAEVRSFVAAARVAQADARDPASEEWLDWAARYADVIDPTRQELRGPDEIELRPDALAPFLDGWSPYGPTRAARWG